jgi:hypothetical protein
VTVLSHLQLDGEVVERLGQKSAAVPMRQCHRQRGPITLVSATLGHADLKTTSVYAHARPGESSSRYPKRSRVATPRRLTICPDHDALMRDTQRSELTEMCQTNALEVRLPQLWEAPTPVIQLKE